LTPRPRTKWPLEEGETLLWEGTPRGDLHFGIESYATVPFAILVLGISLGIGWMLAGYGVAFAPFAAAGVALALFIALMFPLHDQFIRRNSRYALTDRRALIWLRGAVKSVPLPAPDKIELRPGPPDDLIFGKEANPRTHGTRHPGASFDIGFFRIDDGAQVYRLMREQAGGPV
jgi:hypothetical protein